MEEYHVENFGCRASHADGDAIAGELSRNGALRAAGFHRADVVVVNTCSVTAEAEKTARAFLRRVHRENPQARVVMTGCYAQRAPQEIAALPGVHAVVGNSHKSMAAATALRLLRANGTPSQNNNGAPAASVSFVPLGSVQPAPSAPSILVDDLFAHADLAAPLSTPDAHEGAADTRPNLKVQDGCGNRCSFCIIPTTRGASRSVPLADVLDSVSSFVDCGGSELVLSGINLGRWGRDLRPSSRLEDLVASILARTRLPRLRISSVEPMDWTPALLDLYREYGSSHAATTGPRLARHAHLPLQSGSDTTLRAMHRRYRPWHYEEKLAAIRAALPDAAIGADVMVGFPGETDAHFEESYSFIARQPFTYLHLFPFSARPDTPGWELHRTHPVPPPVVNERLGRLRALIATRNRAFRERFIGRNLPVVTLKTPAEERARGLCRALSDNFLKIELRAELQSNQMLEADITTLRGDGLTATPLGS